MLWEVVLVHKVMAGMWWLSELYLCPAMRNVWGVPQSLSVVPESESVAAGSYGVCSKAMHRGVWS
jgi:hypothetical protein